MKAIMNKNYLTRLIKKSKIGEFTDHTSSITNLLLSILIFSSGVVLLVSALIPGIRGRIIVV